MNSKLLLDIFINMAISLQCLASCPALVGTVYTCVDASQAEVQSCIDAAESASGGTVNIPAGSVIWASDITKTITKDIVIQGAGSGIDGTVITGGGFRDVQANGATSLTIKDMRFIMSASAYATGIVSVRGASLNKILKNLYIDMSSMTSGRGIMVGSVNDMAQGGGVISGCTFSNPTGTEQGISINGDSSGSSKVWTGNPQFGTANAKKYIKVDGGGTVIYASSYLGSDSAGTKIAAGDTDDQIKTTGYFVKSDDGVYTQGTALGGSSAYAY